MPGSAHAYVTAKDLLECFRGLGNFCQISCTNRLSFLVISHYLSGISALFTSGRHFYGICYAILIMTSYLSAQVAAILCLGRVCSWNPAYHGQRTRARSSTSFSTCTSYCISSSGFVRRSFSCQFVSLSTLFLHCIL